MLEAKKGGLSLFMERTPLASDVAVSICFEANANNCILNRLNGGLTCISNCYPKGAEEACVCYAMFLMVKGVLCGTPEASAKSKVSDVVCGHHDGQFSLSWKVKGTGSAVRKSLGLALKCLHPGKMFAIYSRLVKSLDMSPKRDTFDYVANELAESIRKDTCCGVIGNIKLKKEILDKMMEVLPKKHSPSAVSGKKTKPSEHKPCDHSEWEEVKVSGWKMGIVKDFLSNKLMGVQLSPQDKGLLVVWPKKQFETAMDKMKKTAGDFVAAKYTKVGDELCNVMGYSLLANAVVCAHEVKALLKASLTPAVLTAALTSAL